MERCELLLVVKVKTMRGGKKRTEGAGQAGNKITGDKWLSPVAEDGFLFKKKVGILKINCSVFLLFFFFHFCFYLL